MKDKKYKPITEQFVERQIIKYLSKNGWGTNLEYGDIRDKGVDIKVRHNKYSRYFLIEAKGEGSANIKNINSRREVIFIYALGQILTRMTTSSATRYYYGIGLPEMSAKKAIKRIPWQIAKKLLFYIFSVNTKGDVIKYSWQDLRDIQK
jgi:hypothetical protein